MTSPSDQSGSEHLKIIFVKRHKLITDAKAGVDTHTSRGPPRVPSRPSEASSAVVPRPQTVMVVEGETSRVFPQSFDVSSEVSPTDDVTGPPS